MFAPILKALIDFSKSSTFFHPVPCSDGTIEKTENIDGNLQQMQKMMKIYNRKVRDFFFSDSFDRKLVKIVEECH